MFSYLFHNILKMHIETQAGVDEFFYLTAKMLHSYCLHDFAYITAINSTFTWSD